MTVKIALAGNPNSGKTTLFNALTGSNQFVGNWPGVTVEKKEGKIKGLGEKEGEEIILVDLPGIYSLSPYSLEEVVSRNFLLNENPDVIINIVDGLNPERNLYLTTQLAELGIPMVVAVNMMDAVRKKGDEINISKLSKALGCEVLEISALKGEGIQLLAERAVAAAKSQKAVRPHKFSGSVEHALAHIEECALLDIAEDKQRWFSVKLFERDEKITKDFALNPEIAARIEKEIGKCEAEMDDDSESIIINQRYNHITDIMADCYRRKNTGLMSATDKIDRVVTNRFLALPIFALVMFFVYYISVTTVGTWATDWANDGVFGEGWSFFGAWIPGIPVIIGAGLEAVNCAPWLQSLVLDGIVSGVGAVLGFVPQMLVLFLLLAILEACGYMARVAFIMDKIFRKFGLSGKSFIPILVGTGCGVPGIMASRTIENDLDRKMTVITTTFIPCGAKLPIIALIAGALFHDAWWVAPSAYFMGILAILLSGIILKKTKLFTGDLSPFVMELPPYHMPTVINVLRSMWERGWSFIKKAGTVILLSTIILWFASNYGFVDGSFRAVSMDESVLAAVGGLVAWVFIPLGWGNWQSAVAAVTGLIAKENVVGTFGVLLGGYSEVAENGLEIWTAMQAMYTPLAAYSFLAFNLLCAPCFAAIGAIRREMNNGKWTAFAIAYQCGFAYAVALCIYQIGMFVSTGAFGIGTVAAFILIVVFGYLLFRPSSSSKGKTPRHKTLAEKEVRI